MSGSRRVAVACMVLTVCLLAATAAGCARVTLSEASPRVERYDIRSLNEGGEASQRVEIRVRFDRPIAVTGSPVKDLVIRVDGEVPDKKTVVPCVHQEDASTLLVQLAAAADVTGPDGGGYFALYQGALSITAADESGGLAHVTSTDGSFSAVWSDIVCRIPSGLRISVSKSLAGRVADGQVATATFRVTQTPQIRVVSWFALEPGGREVFIHNHEFLRYDRESYAEHLAVSLQAEFAGEYEFSVQGDMVTVKAVEVVDGQEIEPRVCEEMS